MKAIVFGEIIWDVYPEEQTIGGAPFNFGAHLAHLGDEVYLVSAVGRDTLGEQALFEAVRHGIRTELVQKNAFPTGACLVTLDDRGIPCYQVLTDTAYDNITLTDEALAAMRELQADLFYFNTLSQRSEVSRRTLSTLLETLTFPEIFCDINLRQDCFDRESLLRCLTQATMIKISEEEGHFLYDLGLLTPSELPFPQAVAAAYPNLKLVVYTLGGDGSQVYERATGRLFASGKPAAVTVVSTVGAGDCYGATFASTYFVERDIKKAIQAATERSNFVVSHREAVPF